MYHLNLEWQSHHFLPGTNIWYSGLSWNDLSQSVNHHSKADLKANRRAGTAWNKCWDNLDRASQLGTLLGVAGVLGNCPVLSRRRVGLLMWSMLCLFVCNAVKTLSVLCLVAIISKLVVLCW